MKASPVLQKRQATPAPARPAMESQPGDPRWILTQRVAAGPHFARSALLSNFLLYVVSETLAGRSEAISEHKIGVAVFGRPRTYRTDDDNIVRNYARQLRKRLAEHFDGVGSSEPVRIDIPVGGYIPSFIKAEGGGRRVQEDLPGKDEDCHLGPGAEPPNAPMQSRIAFLLLGVLLMAAFGGLGVARLSNRHSDAAVSHVLWRAILSGPGNTLIVPPDAGFNLLEDVSHKSFPLASYIKGGFTDTPDGRINPHTDQDLRSQQYTDFVSMQIAVSVARQPEYDPERVLLRFPREMRINDLKASNALIIGSVSANPWAGFLDSNANFHIVPSRDMESAQIVNARPLAGESPVYVSRWNEPAHDTYALILFLPNLSATGHILLLEGLDVAGTQAAAELLFHPAAMAPILDAAKRADGSLRPFEILLRATSIESNAASPQIIASRIH